MFCSVNLTFKRLLGAKVVNTFRVMPATCIGLRMADLEKNVFGFSCKANSDRKQYNSAKLANVVSRMGWCSSAETNPNTSPHDRPTPRNDGVKSSDQ
ncbi:hypothetical protein BaRGS_00010332, partial [Batillaria attramentaria]